MTRKVFFYIYLISTFSCTLHHSENKMNLMNGKLLLSRQPEKGYELYNNSDTFKTILAANLGLGISSWFHTVDAFVGVFGSPRFKDQGSFLDFRSYVVKIDTLGNIIDTIFITDKGISLSPEYLSWDDKYLVCTFHELSEAESFPLEALNPMESLAVIDVTNRKWIIQKKNVARFSTLRIGEYPWLHNNKQFLFSINKGVEFRLEDSISSSRNTDFSEGIYLFDIEKGTQQLIVPDGELAVISPSGDQIAFQKLNSVRVLDWDTKEEKTIYKIRENLRIYDMHWSPDGQLVYYQYSYLNSKSGAIKTGDNLIDMKSGREMPFKTMYRGFKSYSWK